MHIQPYSRTAGQAGPTKVSRSDLPTESEALLRRLDLYATLQALNAELLATPSATLTLEGWCRRHGLGSGRVVARLRETAMVPATAEQRLRLRAGEGETVAYRRVELVCGDLLLSEAENWYLPSRLTDEMNRQLATSQTPFGRVIWPLRPFRRPSQVWHLWQPLPSDWTALPRDELAAWLLDAPDLSERPEASLFEHRALVFAEDGRPLAEVREIYKMALIGFRLA